MSCYRKPTATPQPQNPLSLISVLSASISGFPLRSYSQSFSKRTTQVPPHQSLLLFPCPHSRVLVLLPSFFPSISVQSTAISGPPQETHPTVQFFPLKNPGHSLYIYICPQLLQPSTRLLSSTTPALWVALMIFPHIAYHHHRHLRKIVSVACNKRIPQTAPPRSTPPTSQLPPQQHPIKTFEIQIRFNFRVSYFVSPAPSAVSQILSLTAIPERAAGWH